MYVSLCMQWSKDGNVKAITPHPKIPTYHKSYQRLFIGRNKLNRLWLNSWCELTKFSLHEIRHKHRLYYMNTWWKVYGITGQTVLPDLQLDSLAIKFNSLNLKVDTYREIQTSKLSPLLRLPLQPRLCPYLHTTCCNSCFNFLPLLLPILSCAPTVYTRA